MAHDHRSFALPIPLKDSAAPKRRSEWRAVGMLFPYLWEFRVRVAIALAFLTTAKLANVGVPLILKEVVDSLDAQTAVLALYALPFVALGIWLGHRRFIATEPETFRRVVLWILAGLGVAGLVLAAVRYSAAT